MSIQRVCEVSLMTEQPVQQASGGSIPTTSLQNLIVKECPFADVREFVEQHHSSRTVGGVTPRFCFRVDWLGQLAGAAIFGLPGMDASIRKYSENGTVELLELRRFVLIDELPRNSESRVLGIIFRNLKKKGIQRILSLSDLAQGHKGIVYRATGFRLIGQTAKCCSIWHRNRWYSTRGINRYKTWTDKSKGFSKIAEELRELLRNGQAIVREEPGKLIYLKDLF